MPKETKPLVSIVVLSWNTLEETKKCLENLGKLKYSPVEIIVVDNGSTDGSKDFLTTLNDIKYISLDKNTGFAGGQLAAYKVVAGDFIALVNSDAVVAPDWLSRCMAVMRRDQKVAAVGGRAFRWDDEKDVFNTDIPFYSYQTVDPQAGYAATATSGQLARSVDSISGAAVLIRRSAVDGVGYFDNDFFAYYEETDLFARMLRAGYTIWYEPKAMVWHQIARSTKGKPYFYLYRMQRNRALFAIKNFDSLSHFFYLYAKYGLVSWLRYLSNPKNLEAKAYSRALLWNVLNLRTNLKKRQSILATGDTYTQKLGQHRLPNDITVVIPCYNYQKYVAEAIESVLNQSLKPRRIIVINDGSTDKSLSVIKRFKDRVEVVDKKNEGVVVTKNLGLNMSNTTWTLFLDADDILSPDYLKTLYKKALSENAGVVYTDMKMFGSINEEFEAGPYRLSKLLEQNFIHNSALIQTELLKQMGGYKIEMAGGYEDWELYLSLAEYGAKFAYVPEPIFLYRQHSLESRNQVHRIRALALLQIAKSLHPRLYKRRVVTVMLVTKAIKTIAKNPELIIILPFAAILALSLGLLDYYRGARGRFASLVRTYLHNKRQAKGEVKERSFPQNEVTK